MRSACVGVLSITTSRCLQFCPGGAIHSTQYLPYKIIICGYYLLRYIISGRNNMYLCFCHLACSLKRHIDFSNCREVMKYAVGYDIH